MTASALDPSFGRGGVVAGAVDTGAGPDLSIPSAVAIQPDGKIVVAGTYAPTDGYGGIFGYSSLPSLGLLAGRRYDSDGSVDTSFGVDGQADIPLGDTNYRVSQTPHDLVLAPDGSIFLAADLVALNPYSDFNTAGEGSVVAKLTPNGQPDPTFGTGGVFAADGALAGVNAVAVQADGKVVAEGVASTYDSRVIVLRLTTAGQLDPSFNGTGV